MLVLPGKKKTCFVGGDKFFEWAYILYIYICSFKFHD